MNLEENRDFLAVEEYAEATLERGMDGAYIATLDELFEFAMLLKRRWERQQKAEIITGQNLNSEIRAETPLL